MGSFTGKKLGNKLVLLFLITVLVSVSIVGALSYFFGKKALKTTSLENFTAIAAGREDAIVTYLKSEGKKCVAFSYEQFLRSIFEKIINNDTDSTLLIDELSTYLANEKVARDKNIYETFVLNLDGIVVASSDKNSIGKDRSNDGYIVSGKNDIYIKDAYHSKTHDKDFIAFYGPMKEIGTEKPIGVLVNSVELGELNKSTTRREGLGKTGEIYIVNKQGYMITESRFQKGTVLTQKVDTEPVTLFQNQKETMTGIYLDYRETPIVGASMGNDIDNEFGLGWTLLAEIDKKEVFRPITNLAIFIFITSAIISGIVAVVGWFFSRTITNPISNVSNEISVTVSEMVSTTSQQERTASLQLTSVNETATTMEELDASARISTEQAEIAKHISTDLLTASEHGLKTVNDTIKGMDNLNNKVCSIAEKILQLSDHIEQIGSITNLVTDLSNQINLLALNAAVEAVRAGEHGKGFSVVAVEIRKLADESKKSAEKINSLVLEIQKSTNKTVMVTEEGTKTVEEGAKLANTTADSFRDMTTGSRKVSENIEQILLNVSQQAVATKQVSETMKSIKTGLQETTAAISQAKETATNLDKNAKTLQNMV